MHQLGPRASEAFRLALVAFVSLEDKSRAGGVHGLVAADLALLPLEGHTPADFEGIPVGGTLELQDTPTYSAPLNARCNSGKEIRRKSKFL